MWNATVKGLLSHKLRLALTALAIVLGVSFVSGTYVLTDTMNATFTQLFKDTTKGIDVVVQTRQTFSGEQGDTREPVPESLLQRIEGVDGVEVAEGSVNGFAQFIGKNGKAVTTGGAPTLGVSAARTPELGSTFELRSGSIPDGPDEVAVDARTASKQGFQGFSPEVAKRLAGLPELRAVTSSRYGGWRLNGQPQTLQAVDPVAYDSMVRTETTSGRLADLRNGGLAVSEDVARQHGWKLGSIVPMEFPTNGVQELPVKAVFKDNELNGGYLLSLADYQKGYGTQLDSMVIAKVNPGVPAATARGAIDRVVADFPNVRVQDMAQYKQETGEQLDQLLNLVRGLLAFAIVIALFGIVNTLALSVFERVRELDLLRAVGATRSQLRSMIRWEAVIISVLGAILGMGVGVFFGWTMVRALASQGFGEFAVPGGQLVAYVVLAAVAGVLAAILPGRRAARVDVLRAITTE